MLTVGKLDAIWGRYGHLSRKSLKRLAQETGVQERQHNCGSLDTIKAVIHARLTAVQPS
jgi:hypothetical protein